MKKNILIIVFVSSFSILLSSLESYAAFDMTSRAPKELDEAEMAKRGLSGNKSGIEIIKRRVVEYTASELRDPFLPSVQKKAFDEKNIIVPVVHKEPPPLAIQGLLWGGDFPQAIINNKVVRVGDSVEGAKIKAINQDGITILFDNQEYNLSSPAGKGLQKKKKNLKGGINEN